ncbi:hypothetical protein IQ07DRAFT_677272 [Pyrenochaeta sp. DS3sAY3a]|nr:hypothetical protein IQ07DRAFT_677272 [Pyrenochaeta sp. DS3sAY3a]
MAMARWIAEQFRGLAEGLKRFHQWETFSANLEHESGDWHAVEHYEESTSDEEPSPEDTPICLIGRHGDLKPENILWFPDPQGHSIGILKITDFGIARFSKDYSRKGHVPNSKSYCSPEYGLNREHSPACDVWALGCVFLEMITWFCGGYELLEQSARKRLSPDPYFGHGRIPTDRFFTIYEHPGQEDVRVAKVKDAVVQLVDDLLKHKVCSKFPHLKAILTIVTETMLVVHPYHPKRARSDSLSLKQANSNNELQRRKSAGYVFLSLGALCIFEDERVELSRQSTEDLQSQVSRPGYRQSSSGILNQSLLARNFSDLRLSPTSARQPEENATQCQNMAMSETSRGQLPTWSSDCLIV